MVLAALEDDLDTGPTGFVSGMVGFDALPDYILG